MKISKRLLTKGCIVAAVMTLIGLGCNDVIHGISNIAAGIGRI